MTNTKNKLFIETIGRYSVLVWITSSLLRILFHFIGLIYFAAQIISINKYEIYAIAIKEWVPKTLPHLLLNSFMGFPIFFLLCLFLYKICTTNKLLKIILTIVVLSYSHQIYFSIEPNKFVSIAEQFITQFIIYCIPLVFCIWIFKIQDDLRL